MFLGQLPERYNGIKKAPVSMQFPIIILSLIIILFGIFPGIPLKVINCIVTSFGLQSLNINIWGIGSETGALNTINIFAAVLAVGLMVWLVFRAGRKAEPLPQEDTYAAGAAIPREKYHYTVDFYKPLYRMISPYLRDVIDEFYSWIATGVKGLCNGIRHVYTGDVGYYVMYIILFLSSLIFVQIMWGIW